MDRVTEYFGALVQETDGLKSQQNAMVAHGFDAQAFLGTATAVDGFTLTPTTVASLSVILTPGSIFQLESLEATTWSSLPVNTATSIMKQGLMLTPDTIGITPPSTTGYSQSFLIEVQYADLDTNPVLLPYYNASNPAVPYSGPGNSDSSQNTARLGIAAIQVKAGSAATTGTQTIPTPDAGWVGLYVVTLASGASTITSGNITLYSAAPFIPVKLPGVPSGVQNGQWVFAISTGSSTYTATFFATPAYPFALTTGMEVLINFGTPNTTTTPTLNANGVGAKTIVKQSGAAVAIGDLSAYVPLIYDGTNWRINGLAASDAPKIATGTVILNVDWSAGNDSTGDGSSGKPFLTPIAAILYGNQRYYFGGFGITVQLARASTPGNSTTYYAPPQNIYTVPAVTIRGDPANQANYIIGGTVATGSVAVAAGSGSVTTNGVTIVVSAASYHACGCTGGQFTATNTTVSSTVGSTNGYAAFVNAGGTLNVGTGCIIPGGYWNSIFSASGSGANTTINVALNFSSAATLSGAFAVVYDCAVLTTIGATWTGSGVSGTTGSRYSVTLNGVINSGGGATFPGSSAPTQATGGQAV